ncbi:MAG: S41 family peptidase [Flavobacteriales bacterium]
MRVFVLLLAMLSLHGAASAQCDCVTAYDSIRAYYETNHPGLNTWRGTADEVSYQHAADSLRAEVVRLRPEAECGIYLQRYVHLLKDHHSYSGFTIPQQPNVDENDSIAVQAFLHSEAYRSTSYIQLDTATVLPRLRALPREAVEGVYTDGANYTLAVVPSTDPAYDQAGVVLWSQSRLWSPGMVKMQLKHLDADRYVCVFRLRYHVPMYAIIRVSGGRMTDIGYSKQGGPAQEPYAFRAIDDSTSYMRIASFDGALHAQLDTFYAAHDAEVSAKRNLILDLRGNGGGAEGCWAGLIGYFYSAPIPLVQADLLAAPGNIARYAENAASVRADSASQDQRWAAVLEQQVAKMRAVPAGSFVPWNDGPPGWINFGDEPVPARPARVFILQDAGCASATESLIYYATRHNPRVITIGTNSGGYMAYGNVMETRTLRLSDRLHHHALRRLPCV